MSPAPATAPRPLDPLRAALDEGTTVWRVHSAHRVATDLAVSANPSRFGPLVDPDGDPVPLWYGAGDREGAIFESVFHDVPFDTSDPRVLRASFDRHVLSPVRTARHLVLIDLTSDGLRRIHLSRADLIESNAAHHAWTRARGAELRAAAPWAHGMVWVARQHDRSLAYVLFGDRLPVGALEDDPGGGGPLPLGAGAGLELVEQLADRCGITIAEP